MTSSGPEAVGTVEVALAHAARLLSRDPELAATQAREILAIVPNHPHARLLLARARRLGGHTREALEVLGPLACEQPQVADVHLELGLALGEAGRGSEAIAALRAAARRKPESPNVWMLLADQLDAQGDLAGADDARARYLKAATQDPRLTQAAAALIQNNIPMAESLLRAHLAAHPTDIAALRMLAEVAARLRRYADAQRLLERCLELAPSFHPARHNYATVLNRQGKSAAALAQVEQLLQVEPRNPNYRNLKAAILAHLGEYEGSIDVYEAVLQEFPRQPKIWVSYGHALKTARRQDESVTAYRRAIELQPTFGEAYWSLANLKTFRFSDADVAAMRDALERTDLSDDDRLHFEFSLGKALEDRAAYAESFRRFTAGNALRRKLHPYSADEHSAYIRRSKALFTAEFFEARAGFGTTAPDPIFVVGLPRAGSTLIEQILASHSQVEGTMELPDLTRMAHELAGSDPRQEAQRYPQGLQALTPETARALGERYITDTRIQRKTDAPFFIDKMPNNFLHVGLIHMILPNARIIDARRHPLGCCFSAFKQQFARGQSFSYGLEDLGRYYRDYVELMTHFDAVLPERVHRVFYEEMIENTEAVVRRLLAHCGLPFEEQCLRFYENSRAVRTASSEQVRQPIFRDGMDHWRHFEPWLGPLERALGPALEHYPQVAPSASSLPSDIQQ